MACGSCGVGFGVVAGYGVCGVGVVCGGAGGLWVCGGVDAAGAVGDAWAWWGVGAVVGGWALGGGASGGEYAFAVG